MVYLVSDQSVFSENYIVYYIFNYIVYEAQSAGLITFLEQEWKTYSPDEPLRYHFLDENFKKLIQNDIKMGQIVSIFTILAILISCLGLFGLSAYIGNH